MKIKKRFNYISSYGYYAVIYEDGTLAIGVDWPREGGILWSGLYNGENTPYLQEVKKEERHVYNQIIKYFEEHPDAPREGQTFEKTKTRTKNEIMADSKLTDIQKLEEVFGMSKDTLKKVDPQLYYAILGVLDGTKKPDPSGYFSK